MVPPLIPASFLGAAIILLTSAVSFGQSVPLAAGQDETWLWPAPVRQAQHVEVAGETTWVADAYPLNTLRSPAPLAPHHVIVSPSRRPTTENAASMHASAHPPHFAHHRRVQPSPALLPGANQRETWKAPYSYGYFGASGTRHWTKHHGYRDRYKEWRLH